MFLVADTQAPLQVAFVETIFRPKSLACANHSNSRDWLDMYVLLQLGFFEPIEVLRTFETAGVPSKFDIVMQHLCQLPLRPDDEGYKELLLQAPSLGLMRNYFTTLRYQTEVTAARERLG